MSDEIEGGAPFGPFENPWTMLEAARELPMEDRQPHLQTWMLLVVQKKPSEQDSLLTSGRDVWGYRTETARRALKEMEEIAKGVAQPAVFLATEEYLAEAVYRQGAEQPYGYLKFSLGQEAEPEFIERLQVGKTLYYPPSSMLVQQGVILFPTGVEEYTSDYGLFLEIRSFLAHYLQLEDNNYRTILCCYVLMSWVYDRFDALPYIRVQGDFGTGKTRLLQAVGSICYRPIMAGGATTPSPVFRIIERFRGTMIIDEADFDRSEMWAEIIKILNCGYMRGFPVLRAERDLDGFDVRAYDCYSPKLLATRHRFADAALESRCLSYTMPLLDGLKTSVPLVLGPEFRDDAARLRNKLLLWRFRRWAAVRVNPTDRVEGAEPRVMQIAQPLLACIDHPTLREVILKASLDYSTQLRQDRSGSLEGILAGTILRRWLLKKKPERLALKDITEILRMEHDAAKVSDRKVGDLVRRVLGLDTRPLGGNTYIFPTEKDAKRLAKRYGLPLDEAPLTAAPLSGVNGVVQSVVPAGAAAGSH